MKGDKFLSCVVLLPFFPNPRMNKRIELLKKIDNVTLIYWNKSKVSTLEKLDNNIKNIEILVQAAQNNPLKRIIPTLRFAFKVKKELKKLNPSIIYTCTYDAMFATWIYTVFKKKRPVIVYEIGDLNKLIFDKQNSILKKIIQNVLVSIEKVLCKSVDLLVIVTEEFYNRYYKKFLSYDKVLYMPNMPSLSAFSNFERKEGGEFVVGFIGIIRYKEQLKMLINAAEKCKIRVFFAGGSYDNEIQQLSMEKDFIKYYGEYDYKSDISKLYGEIDCTFCVYDADLNNVRVAQPNKFYESIYCGIPIIVSEGTYLGEVVEKENIGIAVSHTDEAELIHVLNKLSSDKEYYQSLVVNCNRLKNKIDIETYNERLIEIIKQLLAARMKVQ